MQRRSTFIEIDSFHAYQREKLKTTWPSDRASRHTPGDNTSGFNTRETETDYQIRKLTFFHRLLIMDFIL